MLQKEWWLFKNIRSGSVMKWVLLRNMNKKSDFWDMWQKAKRQKDDKAKRQKSKKRVLYCDVRAVLHCWVVLGYEKHFYFFPKPDSQWTHFYPYIKNLSQCSMYSVQNIPSKSLFDLKNMLQYQLHKEKKMG